MELDVYFDGQLIYASLEISHKGKSQIIENLIVDTGASKSFVSIDAVETVDIYFTNDDEIVYMYGIGGSDDSFRKCIDKVKLGNCSLENFHLDFGIFKIEKGINGLIGLDLLHNAGISLDLKNYKMFQE